MHKAEGANSAAGCHDPGRMCSHADFASSLLRLAKLRPFCGHPKPTPTWSKFLRFRLRFGWLCHGLYALQLFFAHVLFVEAIAAVMDWRDHLSFASIGWGLFCADRNFCKTISFLLQELAHACH